MIASLGHALGQAARALAHRPGFSATCVGTLGVGMGAAVAIFSVLNAVLLRDAFAAAAAGLAAAVLLASWLPARRALRVDPAAILRSE